MQRPPTGTPTLTEEALEVRAFAPIDIPWQDLAFWSDKSALSDHLASGPRPLLNLRRALALVLVFAATCAGGYLALVSYHDGAELSVGEIRMSIDPGHRGALDVYVPLVDWGARFEAIRAPVRLRVDLQTVDRQVAQGLAEGESLDLSRVRSDAREALTNYLLRLIALTVACSLALGLLVAFAIRSRVPRLRWTASLAVLTSLGIGVALVVLLPPRGEISDPAVLRPRPGHPARARGRRGRAAHAPACSTRSSTRSSSASPGSSSTRVAGARWPTSR